MVQGTGTKVSYSASASASVSGYTDGGYNCVASKLIDGDTSTYYWSTSSQTSGMYARVDLGAEVRFDAVQISAPAHGDYCTNANVQLSSDGRTWTTIGTFTSSRSTAVTKTYAVPSSVESFRRTLDQKLIDASLEAPEGGRLYDDAYSGVTTVAVTSGKTTLSVKTVGVGGDFFLFHPLTLRSGSYLTANDYMNDRVLLDEELAWALFGSYDVAGMSIQIGERTYPVAGVVHREDDFASKKAYQDGPGMFMSYDALNAISETKLSAYEIVMPDMISGFAESIVKAAFTGGKAAVVQNTGRYGALRLWKVLTAYGERSPTGKMPRG